MRRFTMMSALLLICTSALAQNSSSSLFVTARQGEVERMSELLYHTRLDDGTWTMHDFPACAALMHHVFVRFDGLSGQGLPTSFLAIYDLDHPPASSMDHPWQGGITFVRVSPHESKGPLPDYLVAAVNRALKQENAALAARRPSSALDAHTAAGCLIAISGNIPETPLTPGDSALSSEPAPVRISRILVPLTGPSTLSRTQSVSFDKNGSILASEVTVTPR